MNLLAWWKNRGGSGSREKTDRRVWFSIGIIGLYALCWERLGFCLSTGLFLMGIFQVLRPGRQSVGRNLLLSAAATAAIYLLFGKVFHVYFPEPLFALLFG